LAKVTGPNQFSLAVGHQTTATVDDCYTYSDNVFSEPLKYKCTTNIYLSSFVGSVLWSFL